MGPQGLAGLRADAPTEARGADSERAGRPNGARNTGDAASKNTGGAASNVGMREARRWNPASGPLRKAHFS